VCFSNDVYCLGNTTIQPSVPSMPLFFTDLVLSPPCAGALALSKVDRAGTFSVPLELKKHSFPPWFPIRHCNIRFGFIVGVPTPLH
jgi:hypothetical protein